MILNRSARLRQNIGGELAIGPDIARRQAVIGRGRAQAHLVSAEHIAAALQPLRSPALPRAVIARQYGLEALAQMFSRRRRAVIEAARPVRRLTGHFPDDAGQQRAGGQPRRRPARLPALGALARADTRTAPPRSVVAAEHAPARRVREIAVGHRAPVRALQGRQAGIDLLEMVRVRVRAWPLLRPRRRGQAQGQEEQQRRPLHGFRFLSSGE